MKSNGMQGVLRLIVLIAVAIAIWFLGAVYNGLPSPKSADAPATEFSATRAYATLGRLLGPEVPHPVSSPANQAVRDRIRAEFSALGIKTQIYRALGCNGRPHFGFVACGMTEDIIADVAPGTGKAVVLMAHYDSVPAGPGASDDQSGVATILETVRALKAQGLKTKHPIVALITDGEEAGLLGANAFLHNPELKARVGVVVNAEARGNQGPSLMFQTSPGDGQLVSLYARSVPNPATSSLLELVYRLLPNDTDLTPFIGQGLTGYNFAFIGNVADYHTPLDKRANLSLATLQHHGDSVLGIASALLQTDFSSLKGGDDIDVTLFGRIVPRLPASWALPLSVVSLVLLLVAALFSRGEVLGIGRYLAALSLPLLAVLGAAAMGYLLFELAVLISGYPDPSYAHPIWLRIALYVGVLGTTLLVSRLASPRMTALSVWGWYAVLAVITSVFATGFSPYFLFPALLASVLLLAQSTLRGAWTGTVGQASMFAAALLPLVIWLSLAGTSESALGLTVHPLLTISTASAAMTLLPLIAVKPISRGRWLQITGGIAALAVVLAVVAALQPTFSADQPQRLSLGFVDDHIRNRATWTADTMAPLPRALRDAAPFGEKTERATPISFQPSYVAPAGATRFAVPSVDVVMTRVNGGRDVSLKLYPSNKATRVFVIVPKDAALSAIALGDWKFTPAPDNVNPVGTVIACATRDCGDVKLTLASQHPIDLLIGEQRTDLPPDGGRLLKARPDTAVRSQSGDTTTVFGKLRIP